MKRTSLLVAALAVGAITTAAYAAVTFDPSTGTGFVGKGDVQLALGMNNAQIQKATLNFAMSATTEQAWECTNSNNEKVQERSRTSTTQGVVSVVARVKNQITGYNLVGFDGAPQITASEGPALNSCPNANGTWSLTSPAGDPVTLAGSGLSVNGVPLQ